MNKRELIHHLSLDAAKASVFTLLTLLVMEAVVHGSVVRFFNLLWLVVWIVVTSALAFATHQDVERKPSQYAWLGLLGAAVAGYAWFALAPVASPHERIAATIVILLMSWLLWPLLSEDKPESES
jgi:hypothetical protein